MPVKVLLVEDNPGDARLIQECLNDSISPISLSFALDGETALDLVDRTEPDVILLDINLPKLDGHEVLKHMRANCNHAPVVVVMSSSRNPDDIEKAFEEGARDYIAKPSDLDEFRRAVDSVLRSWIDPIHRLQQQATGRTPDRPS
jgi:CheY-like chemotaxis protein